MNKTNFDELLDEELKDPEICETYKALGLEYDVRAAIINARTDQGII